MPHLQFRIVDEKISALHKMSRPLGIFTSPSGIEILWKGTFLPKRFTKHRIGRPHESGTFGSGKKTHPPHREPHRQVQALVGKSSVFVTNRQAVGSRDFRIGEIPEPTF